MTAPNYKESFVLCPISKSLCHITVRSLFQYLSNMVWGFFCFNTACLKGYQCLSPVEILIHVLQLKFLGVNHPEKLTSPFSCLPHILREDILWPDSDLISVILKSYAAQPTQKPTHLMCLGRSITLA